MHFWKLFPIRGALEGVDENAVVLQILSHVRIGEATVLPLLGDEPGGVHPALRVADLAKTALDHCSVGAVSVDRPQHQAALALFEPPQAHECVDRRTLDAIELEGDVGFLGIRQSKDRRKTKLTLHDLSYRSGPALPIRKDEAESARVLGLIAEHFQGDCYQDPVRPFAPDHELIEVGAGGIRGDVDGSDGAHRCDVLLAQHQIFRLAVVRRILPGAARHDPAACRRELERLRKMTAGIRVRRPETLARTAEGFFEIRPENPGFHRDRLIDRVE